MRFRSIRSNLIGAFSLVVSVGILVLGSFSLVLFQRALMAETQKANTQLVEQLNRILDGYVGYMKDLALLVWKNPEVAHFVAHPGVRDEVNRTKVLDFLAGIPQIRPDIDSLVLRLGGEILTSDRRRELNPWLDPQQIRWFTDMPQSAPGTVVSAARIENLYNDRYQWVISLVLAPPAAPGLSEEAFLQVDLNYAVIDDLCRKIQLGRSGYVFIVNPAGELVYHPRQQLVYSGLKSEKIDDILQSDGGQIETRVSGRDVVYTMAISPQTGWRVVAVSYLDELFASTQGMVLLDAIIALVCLAVTTLLSWGVALRISRPIEALRRSMREVETGNFEVSIQVTSTNEVGDLARDCDIAIRQVRRLMRQALVDQEAKRQQDLLMLQSQINPHFLYNTLDSIIWMVELNRPQEAITMTATLARFFRLGITPGSPIIPLRHEIEHVVSYLSIQKLRYREKLDFLVDVPTDILDTPVLKLLLQPLVENALYHGIKEREGRGTIALEGRRTEGVVELRVRDDGVGMDPAKLDSLLVASPGDARVHIGLRNVHERIQLQFGAVFGLSFESELRKGTTVVVRLPAAIP